MERDNKFFMSLIYFIFLSFILMMVILEIILQNYKNSKNLLLYTMQTTREKIAEEIILEKKEEIKKIENKTILVKKQVEEVKQEEIRVKKLRKHTYLENINYEVKNIILNDFSELKVIKNEVEAIAYNVNDLDLSTLDVKTKKNFFISIVLPSIIIEKDKVSILKGKIFKIKIKLENKQNLNEKEENLLKDSFIKYKIKDENIKELLKRLNTPPIDVILAQAAIESAWGTSRFFKEANNCFGIWSFDKNEDRIPSLDGYRNGKKVYLKKYKSISESVRDYLYNISIGFAYNNFRDELNITEDYYFLTKHLIYYSEIGHEYINRLNSLIRFNKFSNYNNYKIKGAENEKLLQS